MQARVHENGETSEQFQVKNGVKQGCVLAPILFSILFAAMLMDSVGDFDRGLYVQFRSDCKRFGLWRLQTKTDVAETLQREFLFADDSALAAHSRKDLQCTTDRFAAVCRCFGLTISLVKTEAML